MYQAPYFKTDGSAGSEVTLPGSLFNGVIHEGALHQVVRAYLANQRQGTASKKNRAAVAGGSRKPWRQKGTGRARQGTIRAVQWRGGGRAFPPRPRSWTQRVPKRLRALARASAFNSRAAAGRVAVIEGFDFEAPRTRDLTELLGKLDQAGKILFLTHGVNRELHLSGRNLPGVRVLPFGTESPYDVVWSGTTIIEEAALATLGNASPADERPRRRPLTSDAVAAPVADGEEA
jgi:large subunit ribosomal protein L4